MASNEDEFLAPPRRPSVGYQRLISWELSQVQDYLTEATKPQKKNKKRAPSRSTEEAVEDPSSPGPTDDGVYLVTNSDGEEEIYYSAPQSPLPSDDDATIVSDASTESSLLQFDSSLVPSHKKQSKSSKKKKKDRRKIQRMMRSDFFQPLCDLIDDVVSIDVNDMELANKTTVLSLSEICLRAIKKMPLAQMEMQLPFLITSLVGHNRHLSGIVSSHVQWLEKLLADVEKTLLEDEVEMKKRSKDSSLKELKCIYEFVVPWDTQFRPISANEFTTEGYHCPLPYQSREIDNYQTHSHYCTEGGLLGVLFHYANYFYPVALNEDISKRCSLSTKSSDTALEQIQRVAIERVNYWIKIRYSKISFVYSKFFKLWPAYVHWARGNFHLAANDFASILDSFEGFEKAAILNEMARMLVHSGDRHLASTAFNKSQEVELPSKDQPLKYEPALVRACYLALQAGVWDTGVLDEESASKAKSSWEWFLKQSNDVPTNVWFLHVAAVESRLRVHAGRCVPDSTPDTKTRAVEKSVVKQWLDDCEKLIKSNDIVVLFPVLNYHLSLVYALAGKKHESRKAFDHYNSNFASFHNWDMEGLPGQVSEPVNLPQHQYAHPWRNLFTLMTGPPPILPIHWRVQLLHSHQPYLRTEEVADCAPRHNLNLRLTTEGDLTGDMLMELPPLRAVILNPYNGSIQFKREASLQHYFITDNYCSNITLSNFPYPLRLFESSQSVIELSLGNRTCISGLHNSMVANYMAVLHWYGTDGSHHKVDIRKLIRRRYKEELLKDLKLRIDLTDTEEDIMKRLNKKMEMGLKLSPHDIFYKKQNRSLSTSEQFQLLLTSSFIYGKGTLLLAFKLSANNPDVLVFVDCTDAKSFLSPKIHCSFDVNGFSRFIPDHLSRHTSTLHHYTWKHLPHLKYVVAAKTTLFKHYRDSKDNNFENTYFVFNEEGDVIHKWSVPKGTNESYSILGDRIFSFDRDSNSNISIASYSIKKTKEHFNSYPIFQSKGDIITTPGLLLIPCQDGLLVLHPGTLARVNIEGLRESDGIDPPQDGFIYPQLSAVTGRVEVLGVFDIAPMEREPSDIWTEETEGETEGDCPVLPDDVSDYGSARLALAINDRIVILYCSPRTTQVKVEYDRVIVKQAELSLSLDDQGLIQDDF
uniref:Uncharacterized protein n=1 Tax=Amphimedon queenslandica TaxID=400682 RepID=A0A1X7UZZ4_AMPQE